MQRVGNNKTEVSAAEWRVVAGAIAGFDNLIDQSGFKGCLEVLWVDAGSVLPADGMYIVLEGSVSLVLNGHPIATAGKSDYFYEEHLILDELAVELIASTTTPAKLLFLSVSAWNSLPVGARDDCQQILFGDLVNIHLHEFQQPINCCNITAAAFSITALGYSCDVNDIFQSCSLPVSYVVDDGMTLGELYDVASTYVFAKGLRDQVGVELYYFDKAVMTRQDLFNAIAESDRVGGDGDILVANFGVGIAHGKPEMGGGHFALIAKCNQSTGLVHMMDVHPAKYGKIWVTSIDRLYDAMSDYDGSSHRSRGLMRFIVKEDIDVRLDALAKSDCFPVNCTRYLDLTPEKRRHIFSRSSTNLNSFHVLTMALRILDSAPVVVDEILEAANLSYTQALSVERTAAQLSEVANDYLAELDFTDIRVSLKSFDDSDAESKENWFKTQLLGIAGNPHAHFMINVNYNEIMGYEAIHEISSQFLETPVFKEFWCVCIDYEYENDVVILADMSPATSQIWRAPRAKVFRGLQEKNSPAVLYLEKVEAARDEGDFHHILERHPLVLFHEGANRETRQLQSLFANIGATTLHSVDISGYDPLTRAIRRKLVARAGADNAACLFLEGDYLGGIEEIVALVHEGTLQARLRDAALPVLPREETPSLDRNVFSYPKGGLTAPYDGKHSILLCACGSPAASRVPQLIARLKSEGHKVRLLLTGASESFFQDIGMEQVLEHLRPSDIYRDEDDWKFQFVEGGVPVRATHLALSEWADCLLVAPVTANTLGKMASGVADNLLTSVFLGWDTRKPSILCPASDSPLWESAVTQDNLKVLSERGVTFEGPRSGILANGRQATGIIASVDEIVERTTASLAGSHLAQTVLRWAKSAAANNDTKKWERVVRSIDADGVDINSTDEVCGDSFLHYAAGGEGALNAVGVERGIANLAAISALLERGIDVNLRNRYEVTALRVATLNEAKEAVELLRGAGAQPGSEGS